MDKLPPTKRRKKSGAQRRSEVKLALAISSNRSITDFWRSSARPSIPPTRPDRSGSPPDPARPVGSSATVQRSPAKEAECDPDSPDELGPGPSRSSARPSIPPTRPDRSGSPPDPARPVGSSATVQRSPAKEAECDPDSPDELGPGPSRSSARPSIPPTRPDRSGSPPDPARPVGSSATVQRSPAEEAECDPDSPDELGPGPSRSSARPSIPPTRPDRSGSPPDPARPVGSSATVQRSPAKEAECDPDSPDELGPGPSRSNRPGPEIDLDRPVDIGRLLKKSESGSLSAAEVRHCLTNRWTPKEAIEFLSSTHQVKNKKGETVEAVRRVQTAHLVRYNWLAVSNAPGFKGVWCAECVLFKNTTHHVGAFVSRPLTAFKCAMGKDGAYENHQNSHTHKTCRARAAEFLNRTRGDGATSDYDIRHQVDQARKATAEANRQALRPIIDVVLTCARQNIALRGHRDDGRLEEQEPEVSDGNFRSLIRLLLRHGDNVLKEHIERAPANATYLSKTVQNDILECAAAVIRDSIRRTVGQHFYSILADETTDRAGREQLVIVVRYATQQEGSWCIKEDPVRVVDLLSEIRQTSGMPDEEVEVQMTGENIGSVILEKVGELFGDTDKMVGCGFDGAAAMSSKNVGAAAVLKRANPLCEYFHCAMHALNLCVAAGCKQRDVQVCMTTVQTVTSFFNMSPKRMHALQRTIQAKSPQQPRKKLITLCTTRFLERHDSIIVFCELLPVVIHCLTEMESWHSTDTRSKAVQLLGSLRSSSFLVALFALEAVSALLLPVSRGLQAKGIDVATAAQGLDACIETLQGWRDEPDEQVEIILSKAEAAADDLGVEIRPPRCPARATHRANAGNCGDNTAYYRINCFLPLLSGVLEQLKARFGLRQQLSFQLGGLLPAQLKSWAEMEPVVRHYKQFLDEEAVVRAEYGIWASMWNKHKEAQPSTVVAALDNCPQQLLPNISKLLEVLAALPVTTAEPERFFSRVTLAATAIRATMSEERLEAICLLQVYRQCPELTVETVLQEFSKKPRKKSFVL